MNCIENQFDVDVETNTNFRKSYWILKIPALLGCLKHDIVRI